MPLCKAAHGMPPQPSNHRYAGPTEIPPAEKSMPEPRPRVSLAPKHTLLPHHPIPCPVALPLNGPSESKAVYWARCRTLICRLAADHCQHVSGELCRRLSHALNRMAH